jgi:hypothetical protein
MEDRAMKAIWRIMYNIHRHGLESKHPHALRDHMGGAAETKTLSWGKESVGKLLVVTAE